MPDDKKRYRVLTGLNYGTKRREPGDIADDIPEQSIGWLLKQKHIEFVEPKKDGS